MDKLRVTRDGEVVKVDENAPFQHVSQCAPKQLVQRVLSHVAEDSVAARQRHRRVLRVWQRPRVVRLSRNSGRKAMARRVGGSTRKPQEGD